MRFPTMEIPVMTNADTPLMTSVLLETAPSSGAAPRVERLESQIEFRQNSSNENLVSHR
jgi:hypothetical protein